MESRVYKFAARFLATLVVAMGAFALPLYLASCGGEGGSVSIDSPPPPCTQVQFITDNTGTASPTQACINGDGNRIESPGDNSAVGDTTTTTDTTSGDTTTTNP